MSDENKNEKRWNGEGRIDPMAVHSIAIHLTPNGFGTKILIDGMEIPRVRKFTVTAEAGQVTRIAVECLALDGIALGGEVKEIEARSELETADVKSIANALAGAQCGLRSIPRKVSRRLVQRRLALHDKPKFRELARQWTFRNKYAMNAVTLASKLKTLWTQAHAFGFNEGAEWMRNHMIQRLGTWQHSERNATAGDAVAFLQELDGTCRADKAATASGSRSAL